MMSPLGLLQEGETGEIVERHTGSVNEYHNKHRHRHGHGHAHVSSQVQMTCCDQCENCACHNGAQSMAMDHLFNMGLRPGKKVEMITNRGTGPLVLRVDECRIAMGRGAAMKIYVRRNAQ